jgi:hypothetical protein
VHKEICFILISEGEVLQDDIKIEELGDFNSCPNRQANF